MIKLENEGYVFFSESGLKYNLYEGLTMGIPTPYTSDLIFIMLDVDHWDVVENWFVGYMAGASLLELDIEQSNIDILYIVTKYEKENNIYDPASIAH